MHYESYSLEFLINSLVRLLNNGPTLSVGLSNYEISVNQLASVPRLAQFLWTTPKLVLTTNLSLIAN